MNILGRLFGFSFAACLAAGAHAQGDAGRNYPNKPVRIVVGQAAGGGGDTVARIISPKLSESLGQPVLVENKPGAAGIIGAEFVAKSAPDGLTILLAPIGTFVFNPVMYARLPYAPGNFTPVSLVGTFPLILTVNASLPVHTIRDLVAYMKSNPAKSNYSGTGSGFQLATELFKKLTGTSAEFVQYKGSNESVAAVISGEVLLTLVDSGPVSGALKGGRVRGLAVTSPARLAAFPDIPTMAEVGLRELEMQFWFGLLVPAGTPQGIVKRLEDETARVIKLPDVRERIGGLSITPASSTSEELARMISTEIPRWEAVRKSANIKQN